MSDLNLDELERLVAEANLWKGGRLTPRVRQVEVNRYIWSALPALIAIARAAEHHRSAHMATLAGVARLCCGGDEEWAGPIRQLVWKQKPTLDPELEEVKP